MVVGLRVARVGSPDDVRRSWTIVAGNGLPMEAPDAFLAHLTNIERSPNTVEAYARDLCQFLSFLAERRLAYPAANIELLGAWVAALRVPSENVLVLNGDDIFVRKTSTVLRKISAVVSFYEFATRSGRCSDRLLQVLRPAGTKDLQVVPPPRRGIRGRRDAQEDVLWGQRVFENFEDEVRSRLE